MIANDDFFDVAHEEIVIGQEGEISNEEVNLAETTEEVETSEHPFLFEEDSDQCKFVCLDCGRELKSQASLARHMVRVHSDVSLQGLLVTGESKNEQKGANKPFMLEDDSHQLLQNRKSFMCPICQKYFKSKGNRNQHVATVHGKSEKKGDGPKKTFSCPFCQKSFNHNGYRNQHVDNVHKSTGHKCDICSHVFKWKRNLVAHKADHEKPAVLHVPVACPLCEKTFKHEINLKRHKKYVHGNNLKKRKCGHCGKLFKYNSALQLHIKTFHEGPITRFTCELCHRTFSSKGNMRAHIKLLHFSARYECYCGKTCKNSLALKRHKQTRHVEEEYPLNSMKRQGTEHLQCQLCSQRFALKNLLTSHYRKKHGKCPSKCQYCDADFPIKSDLEYHEQLHVTNAGFECANCKLYFETVSQLEKHLRKHEKQEESARAHCTMCNKSCSTALILRQHVLHFHSASKSVPKHYSCSMCNAAFVVERNMEVHRLGAHSYKDTEVAIHQYLPIACPYCNEVFSEENRFQEHMNYIHNSQNHIKCKYCFQWLADEDLHEKHCNALHSTINPYSCLVCFKSFCHQSHLIEHWLSHGIEYQTEPCRKCYRIYHTKQGLYLHVQGHSKERFQCELCSRCFTRQSTLTLHKKSPCVHNCHLCSYSSSSQKYFSKHLEKHKTGARVISKPNIKLSRRHVNSEEDEMSCACVCGKVFNSKFRLKKHILQHIELNYVPVTATTP